MLLEIDLPADTPLFSLRTSLDGSTYHLRFDYHQRQDRWFLTLSDADEASIRSGAKVVCGIPMFASCVDSRMPKGFLIFYDLADPAAEAPGFSELGRRVKLYYSPGASGVDAPLLHT